MNIFVALLFSLYHELHPLGHSASSIGWCELFLLMEWWNHRIKILWFHSYGCIWCQRTLLV